MEARKRSTKKNSKPGTQVKGVREISSGAVAARAKTASLKPGEICVDAEPPPPDREEHRRWLMARVEQLEELGFDAAWPSVFLPLRTDVRELLGRVRRILEERGFQVRGVPDNLLNQVGDGKTWVVRCMPTAKIPPGQDSADLAWRCLESEDVKVSARPTWENGSLLVALDEVSMQPLPQLPNSGSTETKRRSIVDPLIAAKGWSTLQWANEAGVDYHTADNYLKGKTKKLRADARERLARVLGLTASELPR
jgi:hypothetical protein